MSEITYNQVLYPIHIPAYILYIANIRRIQSIWATWKLEVIYSLHLHCTGSPFTQLPHLSAG